jgi:DNA-binding SARP family transcriptional activator
VIERDGQTVQFGDVQAKLLALLAAVRRPVTTDWIVTALWPDADLDAGRNRLGAVLHRLRQKLNLLPDELIRRSRHGIELDGSGWEIDVWRFWDLSSGDVADRLAAVDLYEADLVARQLAYDDLLEGERARLRRRWQETSRSLVEAGALTEDQLEVRSHRIGHDQPENA